MKIKSILAIFLGISLVLAALSACLPGNSSDPTGNSQTTGGTTTKAPAGTTTESTTAATTETTTGSSTSESAKPAGELDDIMQDIIDNATSKLKYIKDMTLLVTDIKADAKEYYFGSADIEMAEGLALEPEISSPFSVCLVKVPEGADADSIRDKIKESANPQKWVCMGVDPANVIVEREGDIIILIMTDNGGPEILEAFQASLAQ